MSLSYNQRIVSLLMFAIVLLIPVWHGCNNHFVRRTATNAANQQIPKLLSTNELFMASCDLFKTSAVPEEQYAAALKCHEQLVRYLRSNRPSLTFDHVIDLLGPPNLTNQKSELCYIIYVENIPYLFRVIAKRPRIVETIIFNTGVDI